MKAIKFNTKRTYTPEGQVVVAWVHTEETDEWGTSYCVRFYDISRGITGEISFCHALTENAVMAGYDAGNYKEVSHMPGVEEEKAEAVALTA